MKNLLIIPLLLMVRRKNPPRGVLTAHFILWYGFLRIFVDLFRDYRTELLGLPPGQIFNGLMAVAGLTMLLFFYRKSNSMSEGAYPSPQLAKPLLWRRRLLLLLLLVLPMVIPSDWTQDVPARYGQRHPGLEHSWIYPVVDN